MNIQENICRLTGYGLRTGLVPKEDMVYTVNRLLELFGQDEMTDDALACLEAEAPLEEILGEMLDYAYEHRLMAGGDITSRDLFDTKIMGLLMPRPNEVIRTFNEKYSKDKSDRSHVVL